MLPSEDISMFMKNWKTEILTIPNLLSLFRLILIPIYIWIYLNAAEAFQYHIAGLILTISCLTDALDGIIARRCHMISTVGKILDPLADKVTQFALIVCLSLRYPALNPVLILFVGKELFQIILGIFHLQQGKMLPGALMAGKVCTAVLFISLISLVLFPNMHQRAVNIIAFIDGGFLSVSLISYYFACCGTHKKVQDIDTE